jgi:hypothetical protein
VELICAGLFRPERCSPAEIMNACGLLAWHTLGAQSSRDCVGLRGGSLGESRPGRTEKRAQGLKIPWPA